MSFSEDLERITKDRANVQGIKDTARDFCTSLEGRLKGVTGHEECFAHVLAAVQTAVTAIDDIETPLIMAEVARQRMARSAETAISIDD